MSMFQSSEIGGDEPGGFVAEPTELRAIVALHDALRPSRSTTYQSALAGLPLGDDAADLGGLHTSHATAYGVYHAIRAAAQRRFDRGDLRGLSVAVQGVGKVGHELCRHLAEAGARLHIADRNAEALEAAAKTFGAAPVPLDQVLGLEVDVLAPCAVSGVFDDASVRRVRASIVCGSAHDQLAADRHGIALHDQGVLYVPDYVANAGGAIHIVNTLAGECRAVIRGRIEAIADTCRYVFEVAELNAIATSEAADRLAEVIVQEKRERAVRRASIAYT